MWCWFGLDEFGAREELKAWAIRDKRDLRIIDAQDVAAKPLSVWIDEAAGGLFGGRLLVIMNPKDLPKEVLESLAELVKVERSYVVLWQLGAVDKRMGWWRTLSKAGRVREWPAYQGRSLEEWVQTRVKELQGQISPEVARQLVAALGFDRVRLNSELTKLVLGDPVISRERVREEVSAREQSGEIFVMLDAVADGQVARVFSQLNAILAGGASEFYVFSMLAYQLRTLWAMRVGSADGLAGSALAKAIGVHPHVVEKNARRSRRFSEAWLTQAMTRLLATDLAVKQGKVEARVGLVMLMRFLVGVGKKVVV